MFTHFEWCSGPFDYTREVIRSKYQVEKFESNFFGKRIEQKGKIYFVFKVLDSHVQDVSSTFINTVTAAITYTFISKQKSTAIGDFRSVWPNESCSVNTMKIERHSYVPCSTQKNVVDFSLLLCKSVPSFVNTETTKNE